MKRELDYGQYDKLRDIAEELDLDVRDDYSGRGMFGSGCVAVTGNVDQVKLGMLLHKGFGKEAEELFSNPSIDSMGRGQVVYWNGLTVETEEPDDLLEEDEEDGD